MAWSSRGLKLGALVSLSLTLASCGGADDFSAMCYLPMSLPFAMTAQKKAIESFSTADLIENFTVLPADVIGVPLTDGLTARAVKDWAYQLLRVTTQGNLWLVAIDENMTEMTAEAKVVVPPLFSSEQDAVAQYFNVDVKADNVYQAHQIRDVQSVLASGEYQKEPMDFVVLPEPYVTITINDPTSTTTPKALTSLKTAAGKSYYQGAIFIKTAATERKTINNLIGQLDRGLTDIVVAAAHESLIDLYSLKDEEVLAKYGAKPEDLRQAQLRYDPKTNEYRNVNDLCYLYEQPDLKTLHDLYGELINEESVATIYPGYQEFFAETSK